MKLTGKLSVQLLASKWKRTLSFILMCALLSGTAGLLGFHFLNNPKAMDPIAVALVDLDQSSFSQWVLGALEPIAQETQLIQVHLAQTEAEAQDLMKKEGLGAYFVFPKGFIDSIFVGENQPLQLVLNPNTPLQAGFIEVFVHQALQVLESSQTGIFSTLSYVSQEYPEKYDHMYRSINARYLQLALGHDKMIKQEKILVTGQVEPFPHYLFTTLLFLFSLSPLLYLSVFEENLPPLLLKQVRRLSTSYPRQLAGLTLGWFLWTLPTGLLFLLLYKILSINLSLPFSLWLVPAFVLMVFFIALLGMSSGQVFQESSFATLFLLLYSVGGLFFSGGLLPLPYLAPVLQKISLFFPSYWLVTLLEESALGAPTLTPVLMIGLCSLLLFAAALVGLNSRTKEVAV